MSADGSTSSGTDGGGLDHRAGMLDLYRLSMVVPVTTLVFRHL